MDRKTYASALCLATAGWAQMGCPEPAARG